MFGVGPLLHVADPVLEHARVGVTDRIVVVPGAPGEPAADDEPVVGPGPRGPVAGQELLEQQLRIIEGNR